MSVVLTPELERHIESKLESGRYESAADVIRDALHLLDTQEEHERWLLENKESIDAKIKLGIAQLDRGEGIPDHQLSAHLAALKSQPE